MQYSLSVNINTEWTDSRLAYASNGSIDSYLKSRRINPNDSIGSIWTPNLYFVDGIA